MRHDKIIQQFSKLSPSKQLELIKQLEIQMANETKIISAIPEYSKKPDCYYCHSEEVIKFGTYSDKSKPRFRCKRCKKTFSNYTGTSIYKIQKKHLWISCLKLMLENKTIREIAKQLHLSTATVFNWRHKILVSISEIFQKQFKGIVEMDDIFLPFNQKGLKKDFQPKPKRKRGISDNQVAIMVLADRYNTLSMKRIKRGRISKQDLEENIDSQRLNEDNIICSDSHPSIQAYVREIKLPHIQLNSSRKEMVKENIYHVNKVNSLASEFKRWLKGNFISVSTKHLPQYLSWFQMQQILKDENKLDEFLKYSLVDNSSHQRRFTISDRYQEFLGN